MGGFLKPIKTSVKIKNFLFCALIIAGCSRPEIRRTQLSPHEKFSEYGHDHFLASVSSMEFVNETFLLTEYDFSRLIWLNSDFSEKLLIDNGDEVSGVEYPTYATIIGDKLAVYNSGRQRIQFYQNQGILLDSLSIVVTSDILNFAKSGDNLVFSIFPEDLRNPFISYNLNQKKSQRFGEITNLYFDQFQQIHNSRGYIFPYEEGYTTVNPTTGEVSLYDKAGQRTFYTDIFEQANLNSVKNTLTEFYKKTSNSTMDIISDCKFIDNKLYILIYNRKEGEKPNPREVLVFSVNQNNNIQIDRIYEIGEGESYYSKLCLISPYKLAAFELQTSDIHVFELK